ncbi:MAG: DNA adenine methylase [Chloroflexota bacterium]|nr:DNA adenine methylase [Chloroflexota bacterium]
MNYIGSKYSLLKEIETVLDTHDVPRGGVALDLFAGTGAVAQLLKLRGYVTYANDWQYYSYVTNVAFIEHDVFPVFDILLADRLWGERIRAVLPAEEIVTYSIVSRGPLTGNPPCAQVLRYLNGVPGKRGSFYEAYCHGGDAGRMYYSQENGLRIQAIRDVIETWSDARLISPKEKAWLVAGLIEAADRVANTASVYGAYLKHVKRSAQKPLTLVALQPVTSAYPASQHRVFCEDGTELLNRFAPGQLRLIYVDPPYNHRQYAANYHILETIARWDMDQFDPRGVTGLRRPEEQRSDFCIRSVVEAAFRRLFERVNSEYLLFSYNNEGLLSKEKLLELFEEFCSDVSFTQIKFKRFRADIDRENRVYKTDHTREFLVLGRPNR